MGEFLCNNGLSMWIEGGSVHHQLTKRDSLFCQTADQSADTQVQFPAKLEIGYISSSVHPITIDQLPFESSYYALSIYDKGKKK